MYKIFIYTCITHISVENCWFKRIFNLLITGTDISYISVIARNIFFECRSLIRISRLRYNLAGEANRKGQYRNKEETSVELPSLDCGAAFAIRDSFSFPCVSRFLSLALLPPVSLASPEYHGQFSSWIRKNSKIIRSIDSFTEKVFNPYISIIWSQIIIVLFPILESFDKEDKIVELKCEVLLLFIR